MIDKSTQIQWEATHLRITVFPDEDFNGNSLDLFPKIDGLVRDKSTEIPQTLESLHEGSFENLRISLAVLPIKFDLVLNVGQKLDLAAVQKPQLMSVGEFENSLITFRKIVDTWITQLPVKSFKRIAFGTELAKNVESSEEGYKYLSQMLPYPLDSRTSSDFQLQINNRTKIKVNDNEFKINRLSVWNVINLDLRLSSNKNDNFNYPRTYYTHLILDINTEDQSKNIEKNDTKIIFDDLIKLGVEISKKGIKQYAIIV